jgi:uncharacterized protein (TIGR00252 family)
MKKNKPTIIIGNQAETIVAGYLKKQGHEVITQNWRTKYCEIDIISKYKNCIYFTEVKYRKVSNWGDGLEAITNKKLQQMNFAAKLWMSANNWQNNAILAVASVSGSDYKIDAFLEIT